MMERDVVLAELQFAVMQAGQTFEACPAHDNLVRLNEVREALRQFVLDKGGYEWMPTQH